jgi:hypothetical protein
MEWIKTSERMPEKEGQYITLETWNSINGDVFADVAIAVYTDNLEKESLFEFNGKRYPGFYSEDIYPHLSEIKPDYWMPIPEMPEGVILN